MGSKFRRLLGTLQCMYVTDIWTKGCMNDMARNAEWAHWFSISTEVSHNSGNSRLCKYFHQFLGK